MKDVKFNYELRRKFASILLLFLSNLPCNLAFRTKLFFNVRELGLRSIAAHDLVQVSRCVKMPVAKTFLVGIPF